MKDKNFFITTAISYPNGRPHIGHAYEVMATDAIARYHRLNGENVYFSTGTDDHGQKMLQTARDQGKTAQELADALTPAFREMAEALNCSHDDFIRTSEPRHHASVSELWQRIADNGRDDIYKDSYKGWYSVRDEAFYAEEELTPDAEGNKLSPQGTPVEWLEEDSYFFRLSAYEDKLLAHFEANPDFLMPESRRNEIVSFIKGGLKDLSISRTAFDWGVPVPGDDKHVMYVWMDALTNYLSVLGYPDREGRYADFWPCNLHIIGKDITRFHTVYWPAFLMAADLPLPQQVFAHGFLTVKGEKMSKSLGNVLDPMTLTAHYGVDALRYFFLREVPFGRDGSFSDEAIVNRVNADLANDIGNLAQRSLSMIAKNCDEALPQPEAFTAEDAAVLALFDGLKARIDAVMAGHELHNYLSLVMEAVSEANRYFAAEAPWSLKKENPARMGTVLYVTAELVRQAAILLQPVIPAGAGRLLDLLEVDAAKRDFSALGPNNRLQGGTPLPKPEGVFPRLSALEEASET
ncbi:MAG: methionine--tRNA ligase [Alphaproteobacteria bacterium]|nr:methionine--tRNA ligase [Alphaproteobacteria bacterium]